MKQTKTIDKAELTLKILYQLKTKQNYSFVDKFFITIENFYSYFSSVTTHGSCRVIVHILW